MENLIILLFDIGLWTIYLLASFIIFMLVQLVSYRLFNFNLYKKLKYILIEREVR